MFVISVIGIWNLFVICDLEFGIFPLLAPAGLVDTLEMSNYDASPSVLPPSIFSSKNNISAASG